MLLKDNAALSHRIRFKQAALLVILSFLYNQWPSVKYFHFSHAFLLSGSYLFTSISFFLLSFLLIVDTLQSVSNHHCADQLLPILAFVLGMKVWCSISAPDHSLTNIIGWSEWEHACSEFNHCRPFLFFICCWCAWLCNHWQVICLVHVIVSL